MRFSLAWAHIAAQNSVLKIVISILSLVAVILAITSSKLALKKPLVIERGCLSEVRQVTSNEHTEEEIKSFVTKAIEQRFNTNLLVQNALISVDERANKVKEQEELKTRNMTQRMLVNSVKVKGPTAEVEADRLITVGAIRSVIAMNLLIELSSVRRSEENPYGLILMNASPLKAQETHE